ncbi:MAG: DoxX family protein [Gemmatimonadota bacterium]|nr:DoxX family protein [Gemmatimonadota bacterium]
MTPRRSRLVRAAELALAAVFIGGGVAKLIALPVMVALFADVAAGQWLRIVTGILELCGAALLIWPRYSMVGALALASMMAVATAVNLALLHRSPLVPFATFAALLSVAWLRRPSQRSA